MANVKTWNSWPVGAKNRVMKGTVKPTAKRIVCLCMGCVWLLISPVARAVDEGDIRVGVEGGQVLLSGAPGVVPPGNALGAGGFISYAATGNLLLDISYVQSAHTQMTRSELNMGIDAYVGSYDSLYPQILAGVSLVSATLNDNNGAALNSSAFGLYAGAGLDFELGPQVIVGLQAKYNAIFGTTVKLANGTQVDAIGSDTTILVRMAFVFSGRNAK